MPSPDSSAFKQFMRESEASGEPRAEFTDPQGRRWIYERPPQSNVVRRVTLLETSGEVSLLTTTFGAADVPPETYPAGSVFVAGHEVSVIAHAGFDDPMLSWEEVQEPDTLTRQIEAALVADGWVVDNPPRTPAQTTMETAQRLLGIRMAFTRLVRGNRVRMLQVVAKAGKGGAVTLTALPGATTPPDVAADR